MAARASRLENQDAIDAAIVAMLADPKEVGDCITQNFMQLLQDAKVQVLEKLSLLRCFNSVFKCNSNVNLLLYNNKKCIFIVSYYATKIIILL